MNIVSPALSLGLAVHDTLESLLAIPAPERFNGSLLGTFETSWQKVTGKLGGFTNPEEEEEAKERGRAMIKVVEENPGPLANKTIRLNQDLPYYFVSPADNIILCGKVDWLEHIPADDSVHVIDFKTGQRDEKADSLQLPIYALLLKNCQKRPLSRASYWYLQRSVTPQDVTLPPLSEANERVMAVARQMKEGRATKVFACPRGESGCYACQPFEKVLKGEAEHVGVGGYNQDLYLVR